MSDRAPRVFVAAGEPSGDAHAAGVVSALRARRPDAVVEAFGGPALRMAGATVRFPMEDYTVLGFYEAVAKIPAHLRLLRRLAAEFRAGRYDLVVLVDYPGFNLRLAEAARRAGLRTLYYLAPQLWGWRPGRASRLREACDRLAVALPFESPFFQALGIEAEFVGHPVVDHTPPSRESARRELGVAAGEKVLALFPGSRSQEIRRLWPAFRKTAALLRASGACDRILVAGREEARLPGADGFTVVQGRSGTVLAAADAALVKSGTTTLEAAVAGTPMVVAYRVHPLTALLARRMVTVRWISLVNLVADREIVPELVQREAVPERLADAVRPLLDPQSERSRAQRVGLEDVRRRLGAPGAAGRVADLALELVR